MTQQISEEIRTLSYLLHPPLLDELGLGSAVPWYTQGYEKRTGIHVDVEIPQNLLRLPPDVEVTLFRCSIQESLDERAPLFREFHRVHSHPLRWPRDRARNRRPGSRNSNRQAEGSRRFGRPSLACVGIQGMRERMRQLGGRLEIQSQPGAGTVVNAILPIAQAAPAKSGESTAAAAPNAPRKRILIADDHEAIRHGVVRLVLQKTESDWEVCAAKRPTEKRLWIKALELNPRLGQFRGSEYAHHQRARRRAADARKASADESSGVHRARFRPGHAPNHRGGRPGVSFEGAEWSRDLVEVVKNLLAGNTSYPTVHEPGQRSDNVRTGFSPEDLAAHPHLVRPLVGVRSLFSWSGTAAGIAAAEAGASDLMTPSTMPRSV